MSALAAGVSAALLAGSSAQAQSGGAFAGLAGSWSGAGTISLEDGSTERIRCRATYAVSGDGNGLNQTLVCAADSYKFDLRGNLVARGGQLSGEWSETSRGIGGALSGRGGGGRYNLVVSAPGFNANLSLASTGNSQSVSLTSDSQFRRVAISLKKN